MTFAVGVGRTGQRVSAGLHVSLFHGGTPTHPHAGINVFDDVAIMPRYGYLFFFFIYLFVFYFAFVFLLHESNMRFELSGFD